MTSTCVGLYSAWLDEWGSRINKSRTGAQIRFLIYWSWSWDPRPASSTRFLSFSSFCLCSNLTWNWGRATEESFRRWFYLISCEFLLWLSPGNSIRSLFPDSLVTDYWDVSKTNCRKIPGSCRIVNKSFCFPTRVFESNFKGSYWWK